MDDSLTNTPPEKTAAPTPPPSAGESEKPPENIASITQASTPASTADTGIAPGQSTAAQIFEWITRAIVAKANLPQHLAELVAFWIISTWFREGLQVFPLLAITGPAHDAMALLGILRDLCRVTGLVAEFKRGDIKDLNFSFETVLISAPNLNNRTAALLGNMTNRDFMIVDQRSYIHWAGSRAIYLGEDPTIKRIQHSIQINITPTNAEPPSPPEWLQGHISALPQHLKHYREKHLDQVRLGTFTASGVTSDTAAVANALGNCIVDAPKLQQRLVARLKAQYQQHRSQRIDTIDSVVVEAALALSRDAREHAYASEIGGEANRLRELRGERHKLSPETVGRRLCKLGLRTRRLTLAGNGLTFDKATLALIQRLAAVYVEEDLLPGTMILHDPQTTETKKIEEVLKVM